MRNDPKNSGSAIDMAEAFAAINSWKIPASPEELQGLAELARRSLEEVKALTEYEDVKAQRILTAVAFLAALAGATFAAAVRSLSEAQVTTGQLSLGAPVNWLALLLFGGFAVYAVLLSLGAANILLAVRPKFNIPSDWKHDESRPPSFLFFKQILKVPPLAWVEAFVKGTASELRHEYLKNSVIETYIVADKIRIKLIPLERGVKILVWSTFILVGWLPVAVVAIAFPKL